MANQDVFNPRQAKARYRCDAHYIDGGFPGLLIAPQISYWLGLFTHQRATNVWKGILEVPLDSDDASALAAIDSMTFTP